MDSKELRLGNWVDVPEFGSHIQITGIGDDGEVLGETCECTIEDCKPVPLTPDILERAGFEKTYESEIRTTYDADNLGHGEIGLEFLHISKALRFRYYSERNTPCNYLHQLQNLYFAITGSELQIDLSNSKQQ